MTDLLNRAVWSALTTRQRHFASGGALARRFIPDLSPFAATRDNSPDALSALADLIDPGEDAAYLMQTEEIALPATLFAEKTALIVMMIQAQASKRPVPDVVIEPLTAADHADMRALAELTQPGPFKKRTPEIGRFWGIKMDGRLAAMTGTRLNLTGFTEISGVCTHPEFRGKGLAAALSSFVADRIREDGDTPILHAFADNDSAIALYKSLGFELHTPVNVAVVKKAI